MPPEIWTTQLAVLREALLHAGITARQVRALGITNQRETTVLWDRRTGEPVAPAIVWQDRRTAGLCADLRAAGHAPEIASKTGLVIDAYFSGTKLAWLLDHVPGARARAQRGELAFGTGGQLAVVAADGRAGACHRAQQRLAYPAVQPENRRLG